MKPEEYLKWIDRTEISRPYQYIMLIDVLYKQAVSIEKVLKKYYEKLDLHTLEVMRLEIGRLYHDIMTFKAGIEN